MSKPRMLPFIVVLSVTLLAAGAYAHGPKRSERLPLGDGLFSAVSKRGHVVACDTRFHDGGAHRRGEWIDDGTWTRAGKPTVEGEVLWPNSAISIGREGDVRVIRANNLPKHASGKFPIRPGSAAYAYDRNPNAIREQDVLLRLPAEPLLAKTPHCVPMGMIGFALSGVAIFNAFDLQGRDAPAHEIQDRCNGHPEIGGRYHYHDWSACIDDSGGDAGRHSSVVGYMLDGIPIFGPKGENGKSLKNSDLDVCHGHAHAVIVDGQRQVRYHYHFTAEFPYTIGCFRAQPVVLPRMSPPRPDRTRGDGAASVLPSASGG
jgi:hypothetical protein